MKNFLFATLIFTGFVGTVQAQNELELNVSQWNCPEATMIRYPEYGVEICQKDSLQDTSHYTKIDGELVAVHEHIRVNGFERYYGAIKITQGEWKEVVTINDRSYRLIYASDGVVMVLHDDTDKVVGTRTVPFKK